MTKTGLNIRKNIKIYYYYYYKNTKNQKNVSLGGGAVIRGFALFGVLECIPTAKSEG
jgi:hypothetical protein